VETKRTKVEGEEVRTGFTRMLTTSRLRVPHIDKGTNAHIQLIEELEVRPQPWSQNRVNLLIRTTGATKIADMRLTMTTIF